MQFITPETVKALWDIAGLGVLVVFIVAVNLIVRARTQP
jgi:hypothetical protein